MPRPLARKHSWQPSLPEYLTVVKGRISTCQSDGGQFLVCDDTRSGRRVVVKHVREDAEDYFACSRVLREIRLLKALRHNNLMCLVDILPVPSVDGIDLYMMMPYMRGSLHTVINSKLHLQESHCQALTAQILQGLGHLHMAGFMHRDLCPRNILVNDDCSLRIADFSRSCRAFDGKDFLTNAMTPGYYCAPELMLIPSSCFQASDLWSVGCILSELLARQPLLPGKNPLDMWRRIGECLGFDIGRDLAWIPKEEMDANMHFSSMFEHLRLPKEPKESLGCRLVGASALSVDLVRQLLTLDPNVRITLGQALAHRYLEHLQVLLTDQPTPVLASMQNYPDLQTYGCSVKDRVYDECMLFHREIVDRTTDRSTIHVEASAKRRQRAIAAEA